MSREWLDYLEDVVKYLGLVVRFTTGVSREDFDANIEKTLAVHRAFEIAGESAKKIPEAVRARHPGVNWRGLTGFRDVLAHDYQRLESDIVWDAAVNKAPAALEEVKRVLATELARVAAENELPGERDSSE